MQLLWRLLMQLKHWLHSDQMVHWAFTPELTILKNRPWRFSLMHDEQAKYILRRFQHFYKTYWCTSHRKWPWLRVVRYCNVVGFTVVRFGLLVVWTLPERSHLSPWQYFHWSRSVNARFRMHSEFSTLSLGLGLPPRLDGSTQYRLRCCRQPFMQRDQDSHVVHRANNFISIFCIFSPYVTSSLFW